MRIEYLRLVNGLLGWQIVPSYQHAHAKSCEILNALYGENWGQLSSVDRSFMNGEPIENAKTHIREVCKSLNISVSFCGKSDCPTMRLWWRPEYTVFVGGKNHGIVQLKDRCSLYHDLREYKYNNRFTRDGVLFSIYKHKPLSKPVFQLSLLSINLEPYHAVSREVPTQDPG